MRGMTEFKEGRGPRPQLADATGTERRIHTLLVGTEEPQSPDQIIRALGLVDDDPETTPEGHKVRTAVRKVEEAISDLSRAGLVRGDAAGGYTGVAP